MNPMTDLSLTPQRPCEWRDCTRPANVKCICDFFYCDEHWPQHVSAKGPDRHKKDVPLYIKRAWDWVKGNIDAVKDEIAAQFKRDEQAKWFGLVVERSNAYRITSIVETERFQALMEGSLFSTDTSPKRQFPSIVCFVGETGSGKSTIGELSLVDLPLGLRGC
jgi:hypothetical protein